MIATPELCFRGPFPQHADTPHRNFGSDSRTFGGAVEFGGPTMVTRDSDLGEAVDPGASWETHRVIRHAAPLWLPPAEACELFSVAEWRLDFSYTDPYGFSVLNGEWDETWTAGTSTVRQTGIIEAPDLVNNAPGWTSTTDAVLGRAYPLPDSLGGQLWDVDGFAALRWSYRVPDPDNAFEFHQLDIDAFVAGAYPSHYATTPPNPAGEWPGRNGLAPCWVLDLRFSGRAYYSFEGGDVEMLPATASISTALGTYRNALSGQTNTAPDGAAQDAAFSIELSVSKYFDSR